MGKPKKNKSFIIAALAVFGLSMLLFLTSLDNRIFDLFLRVLPSLTENEKVYVLTLDDDSMDYAGGFPFRREVMADVIVLLKELGVDTIAFDLSYLDPSADRYDPDYALNVFYDYIDAGVDWLDDYLAIELVQYLGRDVDEYFAQAIAFTGNTWLTLTFLNAEAFHDEEKDRYLAEAIAPANVYNINDTKTPVMNGVIPAIQKLLSRAQGAGFVNAVPDSDGMRRRVNLVLKYQDNYYTQLTLRALQEKLSYRTIEVSDRAITLGMDGGKSLRIPRAHDGTVLIKWPKKNFYNYQYLSLLPLIQYNAIEPQLVRNLGIMSNDGLFEFWNGPTPMDYYNEAEFLKRELFAENAEATQQWLALRQAFYESCNEYINGPHEDILLAEYSYDPWAMDYIRDVFNTCRLQFNDILTVNRQAAEGLRGSFVVIGSDATSMTDLGHTTFQENYPNVGTYAVLANMLLSGEFLDDAPWYVSALVALFASLLISFLISRFDTYHSIITGLSGIFILTGLFIGFFAITKIYIGFAVPLISTVVTFISIMVYRFLTASREKAFLHNAFSRYLAPEVISEIINDPDKLNLGGEKREMTAIFTDIQSFSTISEQLDPTNLVKLLNRYLTAMSNIIMENKGTIDKYEGDAIIAFFGAPVFQDNHAVLACRSAIAMKEAEIEINKLVEAENLSPIPLFTRVGINTGEMVVGNMGAENKMDYTIMGNSVNLAARLEGVNKQYKTGGILISEYTRDKIGDEFLVRRLDRVRVVGIFTPLRLFELLKIKEKASAADLDNNAKWEKAMDLYEGRQFKQALELFKSLYLANSGDTVAELYCVRCEKFIKEPPPSNWDAVRNLTEK